MTRAYRSYPRTFSGTVAISAFLCVASSAAIASFVDAGPPNGTDDTATIQSILKLGHVVSLRPGARYKISERLDVTKNNSGIITTGAPATLYMLPTFNNPDPWTMFSPECPVAPCPAASNNSIGIRAENVTDLVLENFKIEKEHVDGSYVSGIWLRNVTRARLEDLELWRFSVGPIVAIDSVREVAIRGCTLRDSWAGKVSSKPAHNKFPQLTGIVIDDNKAGGVGSTSVIIANNTIKKLRFKQSLYEMPRKVFREMETSPDRVGYQTDGITVCPDAHNVTIMGNFIDTVAEGIDAMGEHIRIEENLITNTFDFAVKLVHGASHNVAARNTLNAAGRANMYIAGSDDPKAGNTFANLFTENATSKTGDRSVYCDASLDPAFRITTCPEHPTYAAFVQSNGGVQVPYYNLFHGNTITVSANDTRMTRLFRIDADTHYSFFYGNTCLGPCPDSAIDPKSIGSLVDPTADRLAVGDMDNNDLDDWFVSWSGSGNSVLYRPLIDRTVSTSVNVISKTAINGSPDLVRTGDFDGDRHTDLMFYWKQAGTNRFFYGNGAGRFTQVSDPIATTAVNGSPDSVLTGDFDGDEHTDLLFYWKRAGTNRFFYGNGIGSFTQVSEPIEVTAINSSPEFALTGDFDGDKRTDLLFYWKATGDNRFYYGTGRGSFEYRGNPIPPSSVSGATRVFSFDADLTGLDDVAFSWLEIGVQKIYLGRSYVAPDGRRSRQFVLD